MCVSRGGGVKMHIPFNDIVSVVMRGGGAGGRGIPGQIGKIFEQGVSGVSNLVWQRMFCLVIHVHQHITITMQTLLQITVLGNSNLEYSTVQFLLKMS